MPSDSPYKNSSDLIDDAKAHPSEVAYGTASVGSASNVMIEEIASRNGVKWRHIPFKGESEVLQNILARQLGV